MRVRELLPLSTCAVCRQRSTQGLLDCQASLGCSILSRSSLRIWDAVLFGFRKLPCKLFWAFCKRPLRTGSSRCQECQRRLHLQLERSTTRRHELALSDRKQTKPRITETGRGTHLRVVSCSGLPLTNNMLNFCINFSGSGLPIPGSNELK